MTFALHNGDCLEVLRTLAASSIDAIVADPPAGIHFMGKSWDHHKGGRDQWIAWMTGVAAECLRVAKPGAHALVWALPRTSHWTATAWENAGGEPRDTAIHLFGSGFSKSMNVSKAIDAHLATGKSGTVAKRETAMGDEYEPSAALGTFRNGSERRQDNVRTTPPAYTPTPEAAQWDGFGSAIKPAHESWILLRKPIEGTIARNVLKHGAGALNIDACGIPFVSEADAAAAAMRASSDQNAGRNAYGDFSNGAASIAPYLENLSKGRFPANVTHDGSDAVLAIFPYADFGSAARYFYAAKASRADREEGLSDVEETTTDDGRTTPIDNPFLRGETLRRNNHPTVESTALMRWLCRLITPPNGLILDPFTGSGSTGKAAMFERFRFIGIEQSAEYCEIARKRIAWAEEKVVETLSNGEQLAMWGDS